jgi:hypothetical protein
LRVEVNSKAPTKSGQIFKIEIFWIPARFQPHYSAFCARKRVEAFTLGQITDAHDACNGCGDDPVTPLPGAAWMIVSHPARALAIATKRKLMLR